MATTVERVHKPSLRQTLKEWEYSPEFIVTIQPVILDAAGEMAALNAVDDTTGLAVPQIGDMLGTLRCEERAIDDSEVPGLYRISATYRTPELEGLDDEDPEEEPQKVRWRWKSGTISKNIGHDTENFPIVNSAGVTYSDTFEHEERTKILTAWRKEPFYDVNFAQFLEGRVNSVPMNVLGIACGPAQVLCRHIEPTSDQDEDATVVEVEYEFEIRAGLRPWDLRVVDQGHSGWGSSTLQGEFWFANTSDPINDPVLLDGTGKPISPLVYVKSNAQSSFLTPVENPEPPTHFQIDPDSPAMAKVLIFYTRDRANFAGLLPPVL
jgi:hypothetical protein